MKPITSRTNPAIKHVRALHHAKYRRLHRQFIAEGMRVCSTLIASGMQPVMTFVTRALLDEAQSLNINDIIIVSPELMVAMSTVTTPVGLLIVFAIPTAPSPDTLTAGIVLAQLNDPGNVGTLIRTSAALGISSVVAIDGTVDPWSPKVVQASAGTLGTITLFEWSWHTLLTNKKSLPLCALVVSGGVTPEHLPRTDMLLVIGNEAHGIPATWQADCELLLTLPMPGGTESLNAAVAGSIALYITRIREY